MEKLCPLKKETEMNKETGDTREHFRECNKKICGWWNKDFDECSILSLTRKNKGE